MNKVEFIVFALISAFVASSLTFSLIKRDTGNRKLKYLPAVISLFFVVNFGIRTFITDGLTKTNYIMFTFFALIATISSITSLLSAEKSK